VSIDMATVYYLIPDIHKPNLNLRSLFHGVRDWGLREYLKHRVFVKHKPVGGIKVMYQHCLMLNQLGIKAIPLRLGDYEGNFFNYDVVTAHIKDVGYELNADDVIVCPEVNLYLGLQFAGCRRVLFNQSQSWRYIDARLRPEDTGKNYLELGYDYTINCSEHLSEMLQLKLGMTSYAVTNGIDQTRFFPIPQKRVAKRVLALSRKHPEDIQNIISMTAHLGFDFQIVDGLTEDELILKYQKADIFLATGYPEGLPLPPLEAMNCGCVVVGFTGGGGQEYMLDGDTALVAGDGDCQAVASKLELLLDITFKEKMRDAGFNKAQQYTLDNTKEMLSAFYQDILKL
jgi:glycosyltransferase involved in cell wall biosynthesis